MTKSKKFEFEKQTPAKGDEDQGTLAEIDEGIRDAKTGRTVSLEQVRKFLPRWLAASSSRNER